MGASKKWKYTLRVEEANLQFLGLWMMQHGYATTTAPRWAPQHALQPGVTCLCLVAVLGPAQAHMADCLLNIGLASGSREGPATQCNQVDVMIMSVATMLLSFYVCDCSLPWYSLHVIVFRPKTLN